MADDDDELLARLGTAAVFLAAAALSLSAAWLSATMESYTSWSDPQPRSLTIFAGAGVVAAALAGVAGRSWPWRFAGFLLLAPAVVLLDSEMTAAAVAVILLAGALAGPLGARLGRRT